MKLYKSGSTSLKVSDGTLLTPIALWRHRRRGDRGEIHARRLGDQSRRGRLVQPHDHRPRYLRQHATAYTGSHNLTFSGAAVVGTNKPTVVNSGGTATAFGTATAINFITGVATVASSKNGLMRLYAAGEADIEVSDGSISTATPLEVTVSPLATAKLALTAATTTPTAGDADNLTVTAQDTYGNVTPTYTGSHSLTFSGASASPSGTIATVSDSSGADGRLRHARRRPPSAPASPRSPAAKTA